MERNKCCRNVRHEDGSRDSDPQGIMMRPRVPSSNLNAGEACRWIRDAAVVTLSAAEYTGKAGVEGLEGEL